MHNRYFNGHPSFLLPEKPDVILERYMNLQNFEWLIKEERIAQVLRIPRVHNHSKDFYG